MLCEISFKLANISRSYDGCSMGPLFIGTQSKSKPCGTFVTFNIGLGHIDFQQAFNVVSKSSKSSKQRTFL